MKTLLIVDPQLDFMPGGALPVPEGDQIVPTVQQVLDRFDLVVLTQDWHPKGHMSFASEHDGKDSFDTIPWKGMDQILWPDHCIQGSRGAEFHPDIPTDRAECIIRKGMDPKIDSYSGFYDNGHEKSTGLAGYLREKEVEELFVCGLAADVCVYFTLKDALKEGFSTTLVKDATRALDQEKFEEQLEELKGNGLRVEESRAV